MPRIDVDQRTATALEFAARIARVSVSEVVARLIQQVGSPESSSLREKASRAVDDGRVAIHADYEGYRTTAWFTPSTRRIDIEDGVLKGESFKSPSGAATALVSAIKPGVDPARNGWAFWLVTDTGEPLQSIRHRA